MASTGVGHGTRWDTEELLDLAAGVFAERGYHRTTMNELVQRSTATKSTFYGRFGSKDELYAACLHREADRMRTHLVAVYESADRFSAREQLHRDMLAFFRYAADHPAGFSLLFGPEAAGPAARIRQTLLDAIRDEVARRVQRVLGANDLAVSSSVDMIAAMIIGVAVQGTYQSLVIDNGDPEQASALATAFVTAALKNLGPCFMNPPG